MPSISAAPHPDLLPRFGGEGWGEGRADDTQGTRTSP